MKKIFTKQLVRTLVSGIIGGLSVTFFVAPVSCKLTEEGIEITSRDTDTTSPEIESFTVSSAKIITISCSEKVVFDDIKVLKNEESLVAVADVIEYDETGTSAQITLSESTEVGENYVISGVAYDSSGNSLEFSRSFSGFNENPARLILNEIRTKYESKSDTVEYVECFVLKGGNTFGLEIVSAANGTEKKYSFPSIEVTQGEYITVHGRILETTAETALDELGDDFALSTAKDSCDTARDLWKSGEDKIVSNTDVVIIRDSNSEDIKDAVFLAESKNADWTKDAMKEYAGKAFALGIWTDSSLISSAVCTDSATTLYRSVSRQNTSELLETYKDVENLPDVIPVCASDWLLTEKTGSGKTLVSGATPGYENSSNPYTK